MSDKFKTNGTHVIADFHCIQNNKELLNNAGKLIENISIALEMCGAELIKIGYHQFEPHGLTITAILSESSLDIHTYPEHNYMSTSIYTCGEKAKPEIAVDYLRTLFMPEKENRIIINRGNKKRLYVK
jgi:S-adenosylmethionine decarboxylase proenzyme